MPNFKDQLWDFYQTYSERKTNRREGKYQQFDFDWQEENPDSMKAICPQLFERFDPAT